MIVKVYSVLILSLFFILTQCSPQKDVGTKNTGSQFSAIYKDILSKNCVGCHSPGGSGFQSGATIDFSTQSLAYSTLVNGTVHGYSSNLSGQCNNVYLVQAQQPNSSYLLATLFNDYYKIDFVQSGCDPYSPSIHGASVGESEMNVIVNWINSGALNN